MWNEPVAAKALMGVLPDGLAQPEQLTGRDLLSFFGRLQRLDPASSTPRGQSCAGKPRPVSARCPA
ncbi:hypothetical protein [Paractinoplanes hotanensis]|uniref:Uncharacterized protein n=1 Tax=Paractinoplanes hotanensis TaxID=2906497 RepID=A0ABT0YCL4_9ACTN|nr:hypothetical protein [Actinoplanes hotanensis]MCM4083798.1 hypothetical protein [Actinoplanes hotanensis]